MEQVWQTRNLEDLKTIGIRDCRRLYFGNDFCEHLIPSADEMKQVLSVVRSHGHSLTLVTPPCTDQGISVLDSLFPLLPSRTEVVFNDWGVWDRLQRYDLQAVLGRLLVTVKRDPRLGCLRENPNVRLHQICNLDSTAFQKFLIQNSIRRVELDNIEQGYSARISSEISVSLHAPMVYVSNSRKCVSARLLTEQSHNLKRYSDCFHECTRSEFEASLPDAPRELILKGNSIFYRYEATERNIEDLHPDRLVTGSLDQIFSVGYENSWDGYYRRSDHRPACDSNKPDDRVVEFITHYNLQHSEAKILDSGCGCGQNARYFSDNGLKVYGLDISSFAIQNCAAKVPNGIFKVCSVFDLPWSGFDVICDYGCLHVNHPSRHRALMEIYARALKNGGYFLLRIFKNERDDYSSHPLFSMVGLPVYGYPREEVRKIFQGFPFKVEKVIFEAKDGVRDCFYVYAVRQ